MRRAVWLAGWLCFSSSLAAEPPAELLQRLGEWAKRTDPEKAFSRVRIRTVSEELDGEGKVEHIEESTIRVVYQGEAKFPATELISATRDGKDNREEALKKQEEAREKSAKAEKEGKQPQRGGLSGAMPFHPDKQPQYVFTLLEPYADDPDKLRIGFRPRGEPKPELFVGEAKVDPQMGAVLWQTQRLSKLPMMVDALEMQLAFTGGAEAGPVLSDVKIRGLAGIPLMKKRFRVAMQLREHELKPSP